MSCAGKHSRTWVCRGSEKIWGHLTTLLRWVWILKPTEWQDWEWGDSGWNRDPTNLTAMETLFSPYTDSPGTRFLVTRASSFPRQMKTPREGEQKWGEDWAPPQRFTT